MVKSMKVIGKTTKNQALAHKYFQMNVYTLVTISWESRMEKEFTDGRPDNITKVVGKMEKGMALVNGKQQMEAIIKVNGD